MSDYQEKMWMQLDAGKQPIENSKTKRIGRPQVEQEIKKAGDKVGQAYIQKMKDRGFGDYVINVSDGDVVSEISKLARNAAIDLMVMGTSTDTPLAMGGTTHIGPLGAITADALLWAPCPVLIIPPALIPGLAMG